jgi:hypothetical protein
LRRSGPAAASLGLNAILFLSRPWEHSLLDVLRGHDKRAGAIG